MGKQVLVVIPVEERHKEYLENIGTGCVFTYTSPKAVTEEELANAQIIIGNVSAEQLAKAPKLEWFQLNSAGSDAFCKPGVLREGVLLTNATGAYGLAISEHMLGVTLMMQKHLAEYYVNQKNHQWKDEGTVTSIYGSTTLVVGLGDIGGEYAKRMKALGSYTIGLRRTGNRIIWMRYLRRNIWTSCFQEQILLPCHYRIPRQLITSWMNGDFV